MKNNNMVEENPQQTKRYLKSYWFESKAGAYTDFRVPKKLGEEYKKMGYYGITMENLFTNIMNVLNKYPHIKQEILNYNVNN